MYLYLLIKVESSSSSSSWRNKGRRCNGTSRSHSASESSRLSENPVGGCKGIVSLSEWLFSFRFFILCKLFLFKESYRYISKQHRFRVGENYFRLRFQRKNRKYWCKGNEKIHLWAAFLCVGSYGFFYATFFGGSFSNCN